MNNHGEITAEIGKSLKLEGYEVFYDHGIPSDKVGKIVSTLEVVYGREDELSQLDIMIIEQGTDKVAVLVEIEETSDRPKTFLGDIFGVLFGKHIIFKGKGFEIGDFTTLLVAGVSKTNHAERNRDIQDRVNKIKTDLGTQNAKIGKVVIKIYKDDLELSASLPTVLDQVLRESKNKH